MNYPIIEKLGFKPESAATCGEHDVIFCDDLEKFLASKKVVSTDYGFDQFDELYLIKTSTTLEPLTKAELLEVFEDFKRPQSVFTQPQIEMYKRRLAVTPLEIGSVPARQVVNNEE